MSHYACKKCGSLDSFSPGGICGTCYPASIIKLDEDVKKAAEKAERDFEKSIYAQRNAFIRARVKDARTKLTKAIKEYDAKAKKGEV